MVPAWESVYVQYADVPVALVNFTATGPQLFVFVGTLICTFLLGKFSKKTILVTILAVFTAAGFAIGLNDNFWFFLVMRCLLGLTSGGLMPVAMALIAEVYRDDQNKVNMLTGVYNGVGAVIGALLSLVAGFLCVLAWQNVLKCYWVSVLVLILVIAFVPKTPPESYMADSVSGSTVAWNKKPLIATALAMFAASVLYVSININLSFYVAETGLGDSSLTGVLSFVMTIAGAISGFLFGGIRKRLGKLTATCIYLAMGAGYLLLLVTGSVPAVSVGIALCGFSYTLACSYYVSYVAYAVPAHFASKAITIVSAALALGACSSSYVFTFAMEVTGLTNGQLLPLVGVACLVGMAMSIAIFAISKGKMPQPASEAAVSSSSDDSTVN